MKLQRFHLGSAFAGAGLLAVGSLLLGMQGNMTAVRIYTITAEQAEILGHMSLVFLDDGAGNLVNKTIRISGVNLQLVNGTDDTETANGLGNLIVGYNELGHPTVDDRTGSHNVIVGKSNTYTRYGSLVTGWQNMSDGIYTVVTAGNMNAANADFSAVTGGLSNTTTNFAATVTGGVGNSASGFGSTVVGGRDNQATGGSATVSGGRFNIAQGPRSSVSGGENNLASADASSVTGGQLNTAAGSAATVSGGASRTASGSDDWVAGTLLEDN